jgi:hypothetical protein
MSNRTYGIVCEMSRADDTHSEPIGFHVGWIGDATAPYTACGQELPHWINWGINYQAASLPLAIGGRICKVCVAAADAHAMTHS